MKTHPSKTMFVTASRARLAVFVALVLTCFSSLLAETVPGPFVPGTGHWNFVPNSDFESGAIWPWVETSTNSGRVSATSSSPYSGIYSAQLSPQTNGNYSYTLNLANLSLPAGQSYVLSAFVNTRELTRGRVFLDLNNASFDTNIFAAIGLEQWQFLYGRFTLPAGSSNVTLRVGHDTALDIGRSAYVDNIAVTPVNEFVPPAPVRPRGVVYANVFSDIAGPEWSTNSITTAPNGSRRFLGEFTNQTVRLSLTNLPAGHTNLTVSLNLLTLKRWRGATHLWQLRADGQNVFQAAFANTPSDFYWQTYPESYPNAWYPPLFGAAETNTLGYKTACSGCGDATYRLSFTIAHESTSLMLEFIGSGLNGISEESWGLDDVCVTAGTPSIVIDTPGYNTLYATPTNLILSASASSGTTNISKVEFYIDSVLAATVSNAPYRFEWVNAPAGTHIIMARAFDTGGLTNEASKIVKINGLFAEYFWGADGVGDQLQGSRRTRFDPQPRVHWDNGNPISNFRYYLFSIRWTGEIEIPETNTYTIEAYAVDDGTRVWIDGRRIINAWGNHDHVTFPSQPMLLTGGTRHRITVDFRNYSSGSHFDLRWQYGTNPTVVIPQRYLYPAHPGNNTPPHQPHILSPSLSGLVNPRTVAFQTEPFSDSEWTSSPRQQHSATDFEVWQTNPPELAWAAYNVTASGLLQTNLTAGRFTNSHAGLTALKPTTAYQIRIRHRDNSGATNSWSDWAERDFYTTPAPLTSLLTLASVWKFLDNGSDPGTAWRQPGFNDSAWRSGPAQLGYGDGDEATLVSYGTNANDKYITTYFRRAFNVDDPSAIQWLNLRLLRDDGAVVYLNGQEVWRDNLPPVVDIGYRTKALTAATEGVFITNRLSSSLLVPGANLLAVEIHQAETNSTDISFDLEVTASLPGTRPLLNSVATPTSLSLTWPAWAEGYALERAVDLGPTAVWTPATNTLFQVGDLYLVPINRSEPREFFRLRLP